MGVKKKVVVLGDSAVGKTSLIRRYVLDLFEDSYIATIGSKVTRKDLMIPTPDRTIDLTLMIWDLLGREGYAAFHSRTFAGVHGALLVADQTRKETLSSLERYWIPSLFKVVETVPLVFVCSKSDLVQDTAIGLKDMQEVASRYNVGIEQALSPPLETSYSTSAKTGENVERAFESLGHLVLSDGSLEDPVKELYESLVAMGISRAADKATLIGALDAIIVDFCERFEDDRLAMALLRQEIIRAGIDVRRPSKEGILKAVDYLAEAESEFWDEKTVLRNKVKRLSWARAARGNPRPHGIDRARPRGPPARREA